MNKRKFFYFGRNSITLEIGTSPSIGIGLMMDEDVTFYVGCFIQLYISFDFWKINKLIYKYNLSDRALRVDLHYFNGLNLSINLFSSDFDWKKGNWKWFWPISDKLKGKPKVEQKIIEERDLVIAMPERKYKAHIKLVDWSWSYPRWFTKKVRRGEIDMEKAIPFAGKGENSWDCGEDGMSSFTTGPVKNIPEAIGKMIGSVLQTRVQRGGWSDYNYKR